MAENPQEEYARASDHLPQGHTPPKYIFIERHPEPTDEVDLLELGHILWNKKFFILGFTLACTLISGIISFQLTPMYEANAVLRGSEESLPIQETFLESNNLQAHFGQSGIQFEDSALQTRTAIDDFSLSLSYQDPSPLRAEKALTQVILALEEYVRHEYVSDPQIQAQVLEQEMNAISGQVTGLSERSLERLDAAGLEAFTQYMVLKLKKAELMAEDALYRRIEVLDQPAASSNPVSPNRKLIISLTFVGSLMAAVFLIFLVHAFRSSREKQEKSARSL